MKSIFETTSGLSNKSGETKSKSEEKQGKRKFDKLGAVKRKGKVKKIAVDKKNLRQTGLENWAIRAQKKKKTPESKKIGQEICGSGSAEDELMAPAMALPSLENETLDYDPFFPLSQEMKQKWESENAAAANDKNEETIKALQEKVREKNEEIEDLSGIIKKISGVIPKKFYPL